VRYLILSDIHSNWEALSATLEDAAGDYGQALCCGDLVGYGADPNAVVDWVRENVKAVVRGNHDKVCAGLEDLSWFNPVARSAANWTGAALTPENLVYLRSLPRGPVTFDGVALLHGSPVDEDEYVVSTFAASQVAPYLELQVSFFGHTHLQGGFLCHRNGIRRLPRPGPNEKRCTVEIEHTTLHLLNPGSVGQPRDGDARAAYAIYDSDERTVEFRRTPYDVPRAQAKIREAGLPELLADRLEFGN
jgi:predicted phosphodiesterase